MPPKRGRAVGSSEKTPTQSYKKRTHRDSSPPSLSVPVITPTVDAVVPVTGHNVSSHSPSVEEDPSLIVVYNERCTLQ